MWIQKHSWRGSYPRLLEISTDGLCTRRLNGELTNRWRLADVISVEAVGLTMTVLFAGEGWCGCCTRTSLRCSLPAEADATAIRLAIVNQLAHDPSHFLETKLQEEEREKVVEEQDAVAAESVAETEALTVLQGVVDGTCCLASGDHSWSVYHGARGQGRFCDRCYACQNGQGRLAWRIQPALPADQSPSATAILQVWRAELARCAAGGCLSGGTHDWMDAKDSTLRLTGPGRCCQKCGLVENSAGRVLIPPNAVGLFGLPQTATYRGDETRWRT